MLLLLCLKRIGHERIVQFLFNPYPPLILNILVYIKNYWSISLVYLKIGSVLMKIDVELIY